jgi:hypothetical protein
VALHWKSWKRYSSQTQWINWKTAVNLENWQSNRTYRLLPLSDWLHNWIDLSSFAITDLRPICNPSFSFMSGVGKKNVIRTWMWETFFAVSHTEHRWRCSKITCPAHVDRAS